MVYIIQCNNMQCPLLCDIFVRLLLEKKINVKALWSNNDTNGWIVSTKHYFLFIRRSLAKLLEKSCPKDHASRVVATICDGRRGAKCCDRRFGFGVGSRGVLDESVEYFDHT